MAAATEAIMDYLICGLVGVALGSAITFLTFVYLLRRREDRDLIERRLRAYLEYRDALGGLRDWLELRDARGELDQKVLAQALRNIESFCHEFHLTSWVLPQRERNALADIVDAFEREIRGLRGVGSSPGLDLPIPAGSLLQKIIDRHESVDRLLRRAVERERKRHRFHRMADEGDEAAELDEDPPRRVEEGIASPAPPPRPMGELRSPPRPAPAET